MQLSSRDRRLYQADLDARPSSSARLPRRWCSNELANETRGAVQGADAKCCAIERVWGSAECLFGYGHAKIPSRSFSQFLGVFDLLIRLHYVCFFLAY